MATLAEVVPIVHGIRNLSNRLGGHPFRDAKSLSFRYLLAIAPASQPAWDRQARLFHPGPREGLPGQFDRHQGVIVAIRRQLVAPDRAAGRVKLVLVPEGDIG